MADKGEYGEPWGQDHGRIESESDVIVTYPGTHEQGRRIVQCVNALSGISDPEQFMEDVRLIWGLLAEQDDPHCQEHYNAVNRVAAQLKGE